MFPERGYNVLNVVNTKSPSALLKFPKLHHYETILECQHCTLLAQVLTPTGQISMHIANGIVLRTEVPLKCQSNPQIQVLQMNDSVTSQNKNWTLPDHLF